MLKKIESLRKLLLIFFSEFMSKHEVTWKTDDSVMSPKSLLILIPLVNGRAPYGTYPSHLC